MKVWFAALLFAAPLSAQWTFQVSLGVAGGEAEVPNAALHLLAGFGFRSR